MSNIGVTVITGSLRKESYSRKMGRAITGLPVPGLTYSIL